MLLVQNNQICALQQSKAPNNIYTKYSVPTCKFKSDIEENFNNNKKKNSTKNNDSDKASMLRIERT